MSYDKYGTVNRADLAKKTIQNKIEVLIKTGRYSNINDFVDAHPDLNSLKEKTNLVTMLKRVWNVNLSEEEYRDILSSMIIKHTELPILQDQSAVSIKSETGETISVVFESNLLPQHVQVFSVEDSEENSSEEQKEPITYSKPLLQQAGISTTVALALLTGLFMGLTFLTLFR